ncbi:MAG: arylsulfatase [Phycisphaerae bacterium]|nr:arylsulfatase [Phycisphaerae bacterium]
MKVLSATVALFFACPAAFGVDRPNIIYIMADDMGYGDLGCYGQKLIKTPNIDQLAAEGMRFTQFYSGCTVCAPARCCLMTGLHTGHSWVRDNKSAIRERVPLRPEDFTVAELLKKAGYATGITGKWGLGEPDTTGVPNKQGFDYWFGYLNQAHAHSYYPDYLWRNQEKYTLEGNLNGQRKQYSHDLFTQEALSFVERNKDKSFFLYLAYTIPHGKLEVPSDAPYSDRDWPQPCRNYAAMIARQDADIGKLMKLIKDLGLDEKTIVFFCSDNGAPGGNGVLKHFNSNGPLRGTKGQLYEGGIRVPMIARWPGKIKAGTVSDQVWAMWDFLPTAAEAAGVAPPEKIDGISMLPALLGKPQKQHEFMYWEFSQARLVQAVRTGDWKAIKHKGGKLELYDLRSDIGEKNDIAAKHPEIVVRIEDYLKTARTESEYWPTR